MRIVFMGTPEFAVESLEILLENRYDVAAVVTVPDKPAGRGQHVSSSAVKECAVRRGLRILQPASVKDPAFVAELSEIGADLYVVVAFRILPPEVFRLPRLGAFNLHASLLPKYRGAAPINWAIIRGERESGVTTFFLRESVDTGSVILQARTPIGPDTTAGELHDALAEIGAEIVLHTVRLIEAGKAQPKDQDNTLATPAPKIFRDQCRIDWSRPAREVHDFVRGLSPRPCAHTADGVTNLRVYRTRLPADAALPAAAAPGTAKAEAGRLLVACGDGWVELLELQQEGKKQLKAEEFLRGYHFNTTRPLS